MRETNAPRGRYPPTDRTDESSWTRIETVLLSKSYELFTGSSNWYDQIKSKKKHQMHAKYAAATWLRNEMYYTKQNICYATQSSYRVTKSLMANHEKRMEKYPEYKIGYGRLTMYMDYCLNPEFVPNYDRLIQEIRNVKEDLEYRIQTLETLIIK